MHTSCIAILLTSVTVVLSSCSTSGTDAKPRILSTSSSSVGGTPITDEMIGRQRGTMKLSRVASDPDYAYSQQSPVMVGGGFGDGSDRTYQYLNSLRGPNGEGIHYARVGTCCAFKSENSPFGGEALLEVYEVSVPGAAPKNLYFNWYEQRELLIPAGLTAAP